MEYRKQRSPFLEKYIDHLIGDEAAGALAAVGLPGDPLGDVTRILQEAKKASVPMSGQCLPLW